MIYLLGGSGYVGKAYQALLAGRGVPHRTLSRAEADYTQSSVLRDLSRRDRPEFLINAAGYTGKPNVDACEVHRAECLMGNAVLPGLVAQACAAAGVPWGHVSSGCIYNGARPDGAGFTEQDAPNFTFRKGPLLVLQRDQGPGRGGAGGAAQRLRLAAADSLRPGRQPAQLPGEADALRAAPRGDQLDLRSWRSSRRRPSPAGRDASPFGTYNVINPGRVTTREVVELIRQSGVCRKEFRFFDDEAEFMRVAAKTPRSNCVLDSSKLQRPGSG